MDATLLDKANTALNKAKVQLMRKPDSVFFTTVCFSLRFRWELGIPTAAVDGVTMMINPNFFLELSIEERVFVLVHETLHVALLHFTRLMGRDHEKFTRAADHVINLMLLERDFKMPDWVLKDPQFKGMGAEQVYALLKDDTKNQDRKMDGDIKPGPNDAGKAEEIAAEIQDILVKATIQSKMAGDKPGSIPGEIEIMLQELLNPKLPWQRILSKYLQTFNKNDYSFKRPNRRYMPKHYLPSLYSESLIDLAVFVDTSGSTSDGAFQTFISETAGIIRMMKPKTITFGQFDTSIKSVDKVRSLQDLSKVKFTGMGGTHITPVIEWANENKPQLLLIFTDGEFRFYGVETKCDVLWLIHENERFKAPFGKVIHYTM